MAEAFIVRMDEGVKPDNLPVNQDYKKILAVPRQPLRLLSKHEVVQKGNDFRKEKFILVLFSVQFQARASKAVWWLGLDAQIEAVIVVYFTCIEIRSQAKKPFITEGIPDYPWQKIGMDLLKCRGKWFLVMVDYFSKYFELIEIPA
ncbi:hypothetical protein PR048_003006 [Dryococelus australis]|uniref:Uncharacterized protein n=1 Tax=Dryococelus australis TaxID=614101 RepID=A0ABQ9ILV9_9NEOP|nr:hypothetical protein PR048_003006 [Dryococelus australis]